MELRRAAGVALVVAGLFCTSGGGALRAESEDHDEFSASHLGDSFGEGSMWEMLSPEERAAAEKSGVNWLEKPSAESKPAEPESKLDKAGKAGFSLFVVGLSLAAAAAPFLLF